MKRLTSIALLFVFIVVGIGIFGCQKNPTIRFVAYSMNGQGKTILKVKKTDLLDLPQPQSKYFEFEGWFFDLSFKNEITENQTVGLNTSCYAKWTRKNIALDGEEKIAADLQSLVVAAENIGLHGVNSQIAVTQFVRQDRYNTSEWEAFGGKLSEASKQSLENAAPESAYLAELETIEVNGKKIDFDHFCATLNVVLRSDATSTNSLLCGFVGDLAQVAISIVSEIPDEQYLEAKSIIGAGAGVFSSSDFWADVLAATIGNLSANNNISFAEKLTDQLNKSNQALATEFSNIYFKEFTRDCVIKTIKNYFSSPIISAWLYRNGGALDGAIDQTIMAFADYLINIK